MFSCFHIYNWTLSELQSFVSEQWVKVSHHFQISFPIFVYFIMCSVLRRPFSDDSASLCPKLSLEHASPTIHLSPLLGKYVW